MLIPITIRIQEILTEFLLLRDIYLFTLLLNRAESRYRSNCKSFARSTHALADVCSVCQLLPERQRANTTPYGPSVSPTAVLPFCEHRRGTRLLQCLPLDSTGETGWNKTRRRLLGSIVQCLCLQKIREIIDIIIQPCCSIIIIYPFINNHSDRTHHVQ